MPLTHVHVTCDPATPSHTPAPDEHLEGAHALAVDILRVQKSANSLTGCKLVCCKQSLHTPHHHHGAVHYVYNNNSIYRVVVVVRGRAVQQRASSGLFCCCCYYWCFGLSTPRGAPVGSWCRPRWKTKHRTGSSTSGSRFSPRQPCRPFSCYFIFCCSGWTTTVLQLQFAVDAAERCVRWPLSALLRSLREQARQRHLPKRQQRQSAEL